jgi:hypothetical protein
MSANVKLTEDIENLGRKGNIELVQERVAVSNMPEDLKSFDMKAARAEAIETFEETWGVPPKCVSDPVFIWSGAQAQKTARKKRERISMTIGQQHAFTGATGKALHKNWESIINYTKNPEIVYVMHTKFVGDVPEGQKRPQPPQPGYFYVSDLEAVQPNA